MFHKREKYFILTTFINSSGQDFHFDAMFIVLSPRDVSIDTHSQKLMKFTVPSHKQKNL